MSVYIFLWGAVVVFGFIASRSNYKAKYFVLFSFFLMTIVLGLRGATVGEDTKMYLNIAERATNISWEEVFSSFPTSQWRYISYGGLSGFSERTETVYLAYCKLIMLIFHNPQAVLLITAAITNALFAKFILDNITVKQDAILAVYIYMCDAMFMNSFNTMRQILAISIAVQSIELIKKEEDIKPEHIKDYVNVLDSKSKRLKVLIEDLFEASKASSGNLELNMEKIDITQLLRQAIGEMEEKLSKANLDLKLRVPEEKTYIMADGKKLYRVLENLLSNISKYSLNNTRVYIDIIEENDKVKLTMKNISSYELNFDPEEIMERFKRADESRNTEGSGLGLAIARDLVNAQGGRFEIDIDGDLFKSVVEFNLID